MAKSDNKNESTNKNEMNNRYREEEKEEVENNKNNSENIKSNQHNDNHKDEHNVNHNDEHNDNHKDEHNDNHNNKHKNKHNDKHHDDEYVEELLKQISQLKNDVLRAKAEEINFKKRVEEEKNRSVKFGNQLLLEKFVEQIDLFDKVVTMKTEDPVLKNFLIGFEMINNNFKQILSDEGVKKIEVKVGDVFDPKIHHPLQTEWNEEYDENVILGELKGGYMYKDRVLRPTLVKVNKKEEKEGK